MVVEMSGETVDVIKVTRNYSHRQSFVYRKSCENCAEAEREGDDDEKKTFLDRFVHARCGVAVARLSERSSLQTNTVNE